MKQLKTLHLKNARTLTNQEMKQVLGGSGYMENDKKSCTATLTCAEGSQSCTSESGICKRIRENGFFVKIQCDDNCYNCFGPTAC